jgi:hypothetical protein
MDRVAPWSDRGNGTTRASGSCPLEADSAPTLQSGRFRDCES